MMTTRRALIVGLLTGGFASTAGAQAGPPVGNWIGGRIEMSIYANGSYSFREPGVSLVGNWNWVPTGQLGGVLVLNYVTRTPTQNFYNSVRFGVIWSNPSAIVLTDPVSGRQFSLSRV